MIEDSIDYDYRSNKKDDWYNLSQEIIDLPINDDRIKFDFSLGIANL